MTLTETRIAPLAEDSTARTDGSASQRIEADPTTAPAALPAAETASLPVKGRTIEALAPGDQRLVFASPAAFRDGILQGRVARAWKARNVVVDEQGKRAEHPWTTVEDLAVNDHCLRDLYRPIWHWTLKYAGYGALVGIVLKGLDTTLTMFSAGEAVGVAWIAVVASLLLSSRVPMAPLVALFVCFKLGIQANLFIAVLSTMAVGALFGSLVGMILGTVVGHTKSSAAPKAPDASPEGDRPYRLGLMAPLGALVLLVPSYVWFCFRAAEWLGRQ